MNEINNISIDVNLLTDSFIKKNIYIGEILTKYKNNRMLFDKNGYPVIKLFKEKNIKEEEIKGKHKLYIKTLIDDLKFDNKLSEEEFNTFIEKNDKINNANDYYTNNVVKNATIDIDNINELIRDLKSDIFDAYRMNLYDKIDGKQSINMYSDIFYAMICILDNYSFYPLDELKDKIITGEKNIHELLFENFDINNLTIESINKKATNIINEIMIPNHSEEAKFKTIGLILCSLNKFISESFVFIKSTFGMLIEDKSVLTFLSKFDYKTIVSNDTKVIYNIYDSIKNMFNINKLHKIIYEKTGNIINFYETIFFKGSVEKYIKYNINNFKYPLDIENTDIDALLNNLYINPDKYIDVVKNIFSPIGTNTETILSMFGKFKNKNFVAYIIYKLKTLHNTKINDSEIIDVITHNFIIFLYVLIIISKIQNYLISDDINKYYNKYCGNHIDMKISDPFIKILKNIRI